MQWHVEKLDNGNYHLKNRGAIVGSADGLLYAFLIEDQATSTEWSFTFDLARAEDGDVFVYVLNPPLSPRHRRTHCHHMPFRSPA